MTSLWPGSHSSKRPARGHRSRAGPASSRLEKPVPAPVTTLHQQFSDPAATATEWAETRRVLETAELFWVSTVRADGRPHVTPCVAVWRDGAIHFTAEESAQ